MRKFLAIKRLNNGNNNEKSRKYILEEWTNNERYKECYWPGFGIESV